MKKEIELSISVVPYKTNLGTLFKLFESLSNTTLVTRIFIVDNSPTNSLEEIIKARGFDYFFNNKNVGYGIAHNKVMKKIVSLSKYHLALNPDISFAKGTLENIYNFMEHNPDIGLVMPKVLDRYGSVQKLCKLLPTPLTLFLRRFGHALGIFDSLIEKMNGKFELLFTGYDKIMDVPCLSACFMFFRTEIFEKTGFFDERFFLYLEDFDFSRRIRQYYRTVYYPHAEVYHELTQGSYKNFQHLIFHIDSAIKYFNKWGWFFDRDRKKINDSILRNLNYKK